MQYERISMNAIHMWALLAFFCSCANIKMFFWKDEKIQFVRYFFAFLKITFLSFPLNICLCVEENEEKKFIIKLSIATWKIFFSNNLCEVKWLHVWWNDWSWLSWNIFYLKTFFLFHMQKRIKREFRVLSIDFFLYKQFIYDKGWEVLWKIFFI